MEKIALDEFNINNILESNYNDSENKNEFINLSNQITEKCNIKDENYIDKSMSKNQYKKLKNKQYWESNKEEFKKKKKLAMKRKKLEKKLKKEDDKQINNSNNDICIEQQKLSEENSKVESNDTITLLKSINFPMEKMTLKKKEREQIFIEKCTKGIKIIVDCDFESLMIEKEIFSLSQQIQYIYSMHKKCADPFYLILYKLGPKLLNNLVKNGFSSWKGVKFTCDKELLKEYKQIPEEMLLSKLELYEISDENNFNIQNVTENNLYSNPNWSELKKIFELDEIVYLTGDSENEVLDLNKNTAYIIGGLVDRNRHKNVSLERAIENDLSHAKLPISSYFNLRSSSILATNHIFDILANFNLNKDWKKSFEVTIPKRKLEIEKKTDIEKLN